MDLRKLKRLIDLVEESGIQELEVTEGEEKVRITRTVQGPMVMSQPPQFPYPYPPMPTPGFPPPPGDESAKTSENPEGKDGTEAAAEDRDEEEDGEHAGSWNDEEVMKSPMVGTFYQSASPNLPPYVEVGSHVKKGDILCIIEAMKLMNEIESDRDGVVVEILKTNAEPVEFGEGLFVIR